MAELPQSPLPPDLRYWEDLARRIRDDAAPPLAAYAATDTPWYDLLARRAPWLVAAAAAAMLTLWLALPARDASPALRWIERSLAPTEAAGTLIGGPQPPSVEALMVQFPPARNEERQQ